MVKSILPRAVRKLTNIPYMAPEYIRMFQEFRDFGGYPKVAELRRVMQLAVIGEDFSTDYLPKNLIPDSWMTKQYFNPALRKYLVNPEKEGAPFRNFSNDPEIIFQLKNFFNAIYHIEESLKDLERLRVDKYEKNMKYFFEDFFKIYNNTIEHAYEAAYLLTNLHPDFVSVFAPEITRIIEYANWMKNELVALKDKEANQERVKAVVSYFTSYQVGRVTGMAIDQLGSNNRQLDIGFVTNMLTQAPEYIDKLTQIIEQYAKGLEEVEPNIDPKDIQRLRDDAVQIMKAVDDLYNGCRLLMPFKVLRYVHMLKRITEVTNSILEQVHYANESSQEAIRLKMHELKYEYTQSLFEEADKIETYGLLKQGLITDPMMENLNKLYNSLTFFVGKVLDFPERGLDLEYLDDQCLAQGRINALKLSLDEDRAKLQTWQNKKDALNSFYKILLKPEYSGLKLAELSVSDREELCKLYPVIQEYVKKYDIKVHMKIVEALYKDIEISKGWWEKTKDTISWLVGKDGVPFAWFQTLKLDIERILNREKSSLGFQLQIHQDAIEKISAREVRISPWRAEKNVFAVDEQVLLSLDEKNTKHTIVKTENGVRVTVQEPKKIGYDVTSTQARFMATHYETKINELTDAREAYKQFMELCQSKGDKPLHQLSLEDKESLLKDYQIFQSWLFVLEDSKSKIITKTDHSILLAFKSDTTTTTIARDDFVSGQKIARLTQPFNGKLKDIEDDFKQRKEYWTDLAGRVYNREDSLLTVDVTSSEVLDRAGFLLPQANISAKIAEYRLSLSDFLNAFSPVMQLELRSPMVRALKTSITKWPTTEIRSFKEKSTPIKTELLGIVKNLNDKDELPEKAVVLLKKIRPQRWRSLNVGMLKLFLRLPEDQLLALKEQKEAPLFKNEFYLMPVGSWSMPWYSSQSQAPYPEMIDSVLVHAQPKQVAALKNLYNGFFHLEKIVAQLEKLHKDSKKSVYCYHLMMTYSHIIEMYNLSMNLYNDPQCRFLAREAMVRLQEIYGYIKPELEVYQSGSEEFVEIETPVEKGAFWYTMNALLVLPEHIQAKRCGEDMNPEKLRELQVKAKRNVTDIERIINKSGSYFKLFLESPTMVRLFFEMRGRIKDFTHKTHSVVIDNLKEINTVGFLIILEEADLWEQRLGLEPGIVAEPMERLLSQFYEGMISALDLDSEDEFDLLFNYDLVGKRKANVLEQQKNAEQEIRNISSFEKDLQLLYSELSEFKDDYEDATRSFMYVADLVRKHEVRMVDELKVIAFKKALLEFNQLIEEQSKDKLYRDTDKNSATPGPDKEIEKRLIHLFEQYGEQIVDACLHMAKQTRSQALIEISFDKFKQQELEGLVRKIAEQKVSKLNQGSDKDSRSTSEEVIKQMRKILPIQADGEVCIASALRYLAEEYGPQIELLGKRKDLQGVTDNLFQYIDQETNEKNKDNQTWFNVDEYLNKLEVKHYPEMAELFHLLHTQKIYYEGFSLSNPRNLFSRAADIQKGSYLITKHIRTLLPKYSLDQMDETVFKRTLAQLYDKLLQEEAFKASLIKQYKVDDSIAVDNWQELLLNPAYEQAVADIYTHFSDSRFNTEPTWFDANSIIKHASEDKIKSFAKLFTELVSMKTHANFRTEYLPDGKLFLIQHFRSAQVLMQDLFPDYPEEGIQRDEFWYSLTTLYECLLENSQFRSELQKALEQKEPISPSKCLEDWMFDGEHKGTLDAFFVHTRLSSLAHEEEIIPVDEFFESIGCEQSSFGYLSNWVTKYIEDFYYERLGKEDEASQEGGEPAIWCTDSDIPGMEKVTEEDVADLSKEKLAYKTTEELFTQVEKYHQLYSYFPSDRPEVRFIFEREMLNRIDDLLPEFTPEVGKDAFYDGLLKLYKAYVKAKGPEVKESQENPGIFSRLYTYIFPSNVDSEEQRPAFFNSFEGIYNILVEKAIQKKAQEETPKKQSTKGKGKTVLTSKTNTEIRSPGFFAYLRAVYGQKVSSLNMQHSICQEQFEHLNRLEEYQKQQRIEYKERYIASKYQICMNEIVNRELGLTFQRDEYRDALKADIEKHKQAIFDKVRDTKDIQKAMSIEMEKVNRLFQEKHFRHHAHLEVILDSLNVMRKKYILPQQALVINRKSVFEDEETLSVKKVFIQILEDIAKDKNKPVSKRIEEMTIYVKDVERNHPIFFNQTRIKSFGFLWLKQFCYYLLSLVGLYTPAAKRHYYNILKKTSLDEGKIPLPKEKTFFGSTNKSIAKLSAPKQSEDSGPSPTSSV